MSPDNNPAVPAPPPAPDAGGNVPPKNSNGKRNGLFFRVLWTVAPLLAVALAAYYFVAFRPYESTDDAFIDGHAIQVSPKVEGRVLQVLITDNQFVNKGDPLVRIDPRDFEVAQAQAQASLAAAQSRLVQAKSQLIVSQAAAEQDEAAVGSSEAEANRAQADLRRYQAVESRAVSREQVDAAVAAAQSTAAELEVARKKAETSRAQIALSQAQIGSAEADVQQAEAAVQQAGLNTSYTDIVAPEDGWVTHRTVENGEYVQPGQALLALVESNVWVTANFKETQLESMRPGQPVSIEIDAYPQRAFRGHVDSIQAGTGAQFSLLPPENAAGNYVKVVQRVPVKIVFDDGPDPRQMLPLGASVVPRVKVR